MSTSERTTDRYVCPCGKGTWSHHCDYPDHAYARPSYSFALDCPECSRTWVVLSGTGFPPTLVREADRAEYQAMIERSRAATKTLQEYVTMHCASGWIEKAATFKTRKELHTWLRSNKFTTLNLPDFYKQGSDRGYDKVILAMLPWMDRDKLATHTGHRPPDALYDALDAAKEAETAAGKAMHANAITCGTVKVAEA